MSAQVTPVDRVRSWEEHIRAMEREWGEISMRRTRELLAGWRDAMSAMRRRHDRLVADGLWVGGPSDFLGIIGQARVENTHSLVLAWLLNPTRRHGLGFGLVRRLLEHCSGEPVPAAPAVRTVKFLRVAARQGGPTSSCGARTSRSSSRTRSTQTSSPTSATTMALSRSSKRIKLGKDWGSGDGIGPRVGTIPDVRLEWNRNSARFSPGGHLICGVRTNEERYRQPFTKERRPGYPLQGSYWPAYARVDPPVGRFWRVTTSRNTATAWCRLSSMHGESWLRWWTKRSGIGCTTSLLDERQAAFAARRSQKSSKRPLRMQQRRAMMALAPATVQRMPARLSRAPICLHPASTTPDETHRPLARNCG